MTNGNSGSLEFSAPRGIIFGCVIRLTGQAANKRAQKAKRNYWPQCNGRLNSQLKEENKILDRNGKKIKTKANNCAENARNKMK